MHLNNQIRLKAIEQAIKTAILYKMSHIINRLSSYKPTDNDYITLFGYPISLGNSKVPYAIANITPGMSCESKKRGLCLVKRCYACNSEMRYVDVWSFRQRQEFAFDRLDVKTLAYSLVTACKLYNKKSIRFQESGDFRNQLDVNKITEICQILSEFGILAYTYTARHDLDFSNLRNVCVIHMSNKDKSYDHNLRYTRVKKVKGFEHLTHSEK